jgi:hypothetical protein
VTTCNSGFADCTGVEATGCQTNLTNNVGDCGTCGNACGSPAFTTGVSCSASSCTFTCQANHFNQDGLYADGCECSSVGYTISPTCPGTAASAPDVVQGRLLGASTDWYAFTFPSDNGVHGIHYTIQLTNNGNPIVMTVFENCSSTLVACGGGESSTGYTEWQWDNLGTFTPSQFTQTYPTTFYVQVFTTGNATTCMDYTLTTFYQ